MESSWFFLVFDGFSWVFPWFFLVFDGYPLVNLPKTMERSTI
jgi:hypothetical protein